MQFERGVINRECVRKSMENNCLIYSVFLRESEKDGTLKKGTSVLQRSLGNFLALWQYFKIKLFSKYKQD